MCDNENQNSSTRNKTHKSKIRNYCKSKHYNSDEIRLHSLKLTGLPQWKKHDITLV
jgi:hypothetical protein